MPIQNHKNKYRERVIEFYKNKRITDVFVFTILLEFAEWAEKEEENARVD